MSKCTLPVWRGRVRTNRRKPRSERMLTLSFGGIGNNNELNRCCICCFLGGAQPFHKIISSKCHLATKISCSSARAVISFALWTGSGSSYTGSWKSGANLLHVNDSLLPGCWSHMTASAWNRIEFDSKECARVRWASLCLTHVCPDIEKQV